MRWLALAILLLASCSDDSPAPADAGELPDSSASLDAGLDATTADATTCIEPRLFGAPNEATGLTSEQCGPSCACSGSEAATFTEAELQALRDAVALDPNPGFEADPYADGTPSNGEGVCGVTIEAEGYRLASFQDVDEMEQAGASLTHWGNCGACSTLENFAVYAATTDLTQPVRQCGLDNFDDIDGNIACLEGLGFDRPCAQIWAYNTRYTRQNCLAECLAGLNDPYNLPDGGLNPCLKCDEETSGPIFKTYAGRTRRNSGLASALCRPCSQALPVPHDYIDEL